MAFNEPTLSRRGLARLGAAAATIAALGAVKSAAAQGTSGTIKVGILHSLSGTMAISETTLKDVMLMLIEQQNAKGGLLGKKLEAVVVDPASNWPLFAEKARQLISVDKCAATFGCSISMSMTSFSVVSLIAMVPERECRMPTLIVPDVDRKSTRLNSSHLRLSRMPSSA